MSRLARQTAVRYDRPAPRFFFWGPYELSATSRAVAIVARSEVYRDAWIRLDCDDVIRPDGAPGTHCILHLKPGVSVLPIDEQGVVYLTEEFHYAVGRDTVEVVSGGIEPGEDAIQTGPFASCGKSWGFRPANGRTWACGPFTSIVVSPTRLFLVRELTFGATALEGTEHIRRAVPLAEAVQMVLDSRITHGPRCADFQSALCVVE